jgi:putative peptide zinc metalloprotease protein
VNTLTLRRRATAGVALLACILPFGSAQASTDPVNVATAVIEQDNGRAFDLAWDMTRQNADGDVRPANSATARARCTSCRASAVAFQIVIAIGTPTTVVPQNTAEALNLQCTSCVVAAEARQFVLVVPYAVQLTGAGRAVLDDVRADLADLAGQDLTLDQLHQAVEAQEARVREVLGTQLVLKSDPTRTATVVKRVTLESADG